MKHLRHTLRMVPPLLAVGLTAGIVWLASSLPQTSGKMRVAGLDAPVEIQRNADGIPRIKAHSEADAYFALGYLHAQDRLWQMELHRRNGAGRLAEIFGERAVAMDRFTRTLGFYRAAEASFARLSPPVQAAFTAYAAGVNAWQAGHWGALPLEFQLLNFKPEPWKPADSLVWSRLMALYLCGNWRDELLRMRLSSRLTPRQIDDLWTTDEGEAPPAAVSSAHAALDPASLDRLWAAVEPVGPPVYASNNWVVDGAHTDTGKPILANDPHLGYSQPILWYLARLSAPGLDITGATVPGVPFTLLGHNQRIAWGFTTTQSDVQDMFIEQLDPADSGRYLAPSGSLPFASRNETIHVNGGADVVLTVRETRHGPVLSDVLSSPAPLPDRQVLALSAPFLRDDDITPEAVYGMAHATDWTSFTTALHRFEAPQQNIVYGDIDGNIGFIAPGNIPIRKSGDGRVARAGWTGEGDWIGRVPFESLPRSFNPANGRLVTANNRIVPRDYPYILGFDWDAPYRAQRINQLLDAEPVQSLDGAARIQGDILSPMAQDLLPRMLAKTEPGDDSRLAKLVGLLRAWDGNMDSARPEPLLFNAWVRAFEAALIGDRLGPLARDLTKPRPMFLRRVLTDRADWCDDSATPPKESCARQLVEALKAADAEISLKLGPEPERWQWGAVHPALFQHPVLGHVPVLGGWFDLSIPNDGGNYTVNRGAVSSNDDNHPYANTHGPGMRAIYDLADLDRSRFIIATGQSGNPLSPHYRDMLSRWRALRSVTIPASSSDGHAAMDVLELLPKKN